jgi:hypothetical protein
LLLKPPRLRPRTCSPLFLNTCRTRIRSDNDAVKQAVLSVDRAQSGPAFVPTRLCRTSVQTACRPMDNTQPGATATAPRCVRSRSQRQQINGKHLCPDRYTHSGLLVKSLGYCLIGHHVI